MLKYDSFLKHGFVIKSITHYDTCFDFFSGAIKFLPNDPKMIVEVFIKATKEQVAINSLMDDLNIYVSSDFVDTNAFAKVLENPYMRQKILSIATIQHRKGVDTFLLDAIDMEVITDELFTSSVPVGGLNSLFIFADDENVQYYNLINPLTNVQDDQVFAWLLSVIYSKNSALLPTERPTMYSKKFMQALSVLCYYDGAVSPLIMGGPELHSAKYGSTGGYTLKLFGDTTKFTEILKKRERKLVRHETY